MCISMCGVRMCIRMCWMRLALLQRNRLLHDMAGQDRGKDRVRMG